MARVKNSNCLKFCTQVDPSKTRKTVYFFSSNVVFFFHPLESMDRIITGRKLNTLARFAFQRYFIKENLTNVCSSIDSSSSVKGKSCRNWLLRSFWPCEKTMCSLPLQKSVGEENLFFHHVPLFRIPPNYVCKLPKEWPSKWRNFWGANVFSRRRKRFKVAHRRHKITQYVDCVTKELRGCPRKKG